MTTLHLTLKKKWFDMILSGEKKEEYREIKEYWVNRLVDGLDFHPHTLEQFEWRGMIVGMSSPRHYDYVIFKNGYKKDPLHLRLKY